jgi:hypothetical protein
MQRVRLLLRKEKCRAEVLQIFDTGLDLEKPLRYLPSAPRLVHLLPDWIFENGTNSVACNGPAKARDASNCILQDVRHYRSRYLLQAICADAANAAKESYENRD